ncbi:MAG: YebC/PmpR family DNA-binding transcriptional regulator [Tenericutes bacterium]|nr:YebC/PmpR family DNA-binding transcriptional regulator [Bacilli bacterium]MDD3995764.1 YebC/PmpR family DNA-binding transcriptional regulator [Bacilli bacterium]MDD4624206.1 YebC/PmpR family DNA-binding transcriptional regulator [Bacilli bacterium]MDD4831698.1 YebC/PmpR family DNA-binding transcriptional regulator [Bacilli bacterium]NLV90018.1 YebC/PmpR family DNA-binding transcriptional regulator [Mycoplasmatota bacterium]
MGRAYEVRKASILKTGAAKAKIYTMYAKEIYNEAKKSTDPDANPSLKRLIEKAKRDQVPSDIVKRAIDKVKNGANESYERYRYEGFGPGNSTILIDCLTDNVNRTISDIRTVFSKTKCKLGASNSVSYLYEDLSILSFKGLTEDEVIEALLIEEVDAEIEVENDIITLYGKPQDYYKIKTAILNYNKDMIFDLDELTTLPKEKINLEKEDLEQFNKLVEMLENVEDVKEIYHNVNI